MDDLDRLIGEWGRSNRMAAPTVDRIRAAILAPSVAVPVLPAEWWSTLNRRTNEVLVATLSGQAA